MILVKKLLTLYRDITFSEQIWDHCLQPKIPSTLTILFILKNQNNLIAKKYQYLSKILNHSYTKKSI